MGNAAAVQTVAESSRRRLILQQYNRGSNVLISQSLARALEQRRFQSLQTPLGRRGKKTLVHQVEQSKASLQASPLHEIYEVLLGEFCVQCTLEELPKVLLHLGCRLAEPPANSPLGEEWYSVQELVTFVDPRRILRQVKRPAVCPNTSEYSHDGVTIWQAAKMGDLNVLEAVCKVHGDAYRALDDFDNSSLYYASLCGCDVAVNFVLRAYERECRKIPPDELLRCVTNALNQHTRALLQKKMTLQEVLKAKEQGSECGDDGDSAGGAWFGLLGGDDDE